MSQKKSKKQSMNKGEWVVEKTPVIVVLRVDIHCRCKGCSKKIIRCVEGFQGVEKVHLELEENKLTVEGRVDPEELQRNLQRKTKKRVELLTNPHLDPYPQNQCPYPLHMLFSDENPNACSIM